MPHQPIYSFRRQFVAKLSPKQIGMFHVKHPRQICWTHLWPCFT